MKKLTLFIFAILFLGLFPANTYPTTKLIVATPNPASWTTGLVGYWTMDGQDITGTSMTDKSVNGNTGTISGAVGSAGIIGQALSFNGSSNYVDLGSPTILSLVDTDFTVEAWVYQTAYNSGWITNVLGNYQSGTGWVGV